MRVLLDECVDRRFAHEVVGHDVATVPRLGWAGKRNGELLRLASEQFDVLVTVDRRLPGEHDLTKYSLAIVVLVAKSNRVVDLQPLAPRLLQLLASIQPGTSCELR